MQFTKAIRGWMLGTGLTLSAIVLVGCGQENLTGGNSPTPAPTPEPTPEPEPDANLTFESIKTFRFEWPSVAGANHYRLLEDPDGRSGFVDIGVKIPADSNSFKLEVPLYARVNARYLLESCVGDDNDNCTRAQTYQVSGSLVESIGYFKAGDSEAGDNFGTSVALSDDGRTLAVGADQGSRDGSGEGAVYIFVRTDDTGEWEQQERLQETEFNAFFFGTAISLSNDGDVLAVGVPNQDTGPLSSNSTIELAGGVYVFNRTDSTWSKVDHLFASNPGGGSQFGGRLSLSGDGRTLVVSAVAEGNLAKGVPSTSVTVDNQGARNSGAAYVFVADQNGTDWQQQAYIKASNTHSGMLFGNAVSLSDDGNTLAVGASAENSAEIGIHAGNDGNQDDLSSEDSGAVYLYSRNGDTWQHDFYVKASNAGAGDSFGTNLTLSGDGSTLAVGATGESSSANGVNGNQGDNNAADSGAAYVFSKVGNTWSQQAYIKASNTGAGDQFGNALSLSDDGNRLVVSAKNELSEVIGLNGNQFNDIPLTESGIGAAYVFIRNGSEWQQQAYVKTSNGDAGDQINSVQLSGDGQTLAVGSIGEDSNAQGIGGDQDDDSASLSGAVYLY